MTHLEKTCMCLTEMPFVSTTGDNMSFHKGREYQVDIYPLYYQVYQNGGWYDYIFLNEEEFNKNFRLIE